MGYVRKGERLPESLSVGTEFPLKQEKEESP